MTVRVVPELKQTKCRCGATLEYTMFDVKEVTYNHDWLGDFDRGLGFDCPVCNKTVVIK